MQDGTNTNDEISAEIVATDPADAAAYPDRRAYTVTSTDGIFKNGKLYVEGDVVELDPQTALNFSKTGDVDVENLPDENN